LHEPTQQGIVTLNLGAKGTFVINKQAPNRQIWWSSPISGPRRFRLDEEQEHWVSTRNGEELMAVLEKELQQLLGSAFSFSSDAERV
jgi:frataxin